MAKDRVKIGTWPTPEMPVSFEIPLRCLRDFERDLRVVYRHPWVVGIPAPFPILERLIEDREVFENLMEQFDVMLVPKQMM
jgi:hypothetical protein